MPQNLKLDERLIKKVTDAIVAGGCYMETAAAYAGVSKSTFYDWIKRGERDLTSGMAATIFAKFSTAMELALADSEMADLATITKHAEGFKIEKYRTTREPIMVGGNVLMLPDDQGVPRIQYKETTTVETTFHRDWQAAAWRLERRLPNRWGKRLEVSGSDEKPLQRVVVYLPDNGRKVMTPPGRN